MDNNESKFVKGMLFGLIAGVAAGILLAPKSGKETRQDIKRVSQDAAHKAMEHVHKVQSDLANQLQKAEAQLKKMTSSAKDDAKAAVAAAKKSRDQLASVVDAVKNGSSDDEDLDIAVKNAEASLLSLKKYFKK